MHLPHQIRVEYPLETTNSQSARREVSWQLYANLYAKVKPSTGRERWASEHVAVESDIAVTIRHRPTVADVGYMPIDSAMRLHWRGHIYQLTSTPIDPDGNSRELVFTAKRIEI